MRLLGMVGLFGSPSWVPLEGRVGGSAAQADSRHLSSSRVGTSQGGHREPISTSTDTAPNYSCQMGFCTVPVTHPGHFTRVQGKEGSCTGAQQANLELDGYEAHRVSFFTIQLFSQYKFQEQNICTSHGPPFGRGP